MYRFFKNIVNTVIIILAFVGVFSLYKQGTFETISSKIGDIFSSDKEKVEAAQQVAETVAEAVEEEKGA